MPKYTVLTPIKLSAKERAEPQTEIELAAKDAAELLKARAIAEAKPAASAGKDKK